MNNEELKKLLKVILVTICYFGYVRIFLKILRNKVHAYIYKPVVLNDYEFREFMKLYKEDWERIKEASFIDDEKYAKKLEKLLESHHYKILEWC